MNKMVPIWMNKLMQRWRVWRALPKSCREVVKITAVDPTDIGRLMKLGVPIRDGGCYLAAWAMMKTGFGNRMVFGVVTQEGRRIGHAWVERARDGVDVDPISQPLREGTIHKAFYRLDRDALQRVQRAGLGNIAVEDFLQDPRNYLALPEISACGRVHFEDKPRLRESRSPS